MSTQPDQTVEQLQAQLAALKPKAQPTAPAQAANPTDDFRSFVLWHTWKYGPNGGAGEFDEWVATEGVKLTAIHDKQYLDAIAKLKDEPQDAITELTLKLYESLLSWNYHVPAQFRLHSYSFRIIEVRINVCGIQGNRYAIHPVIDKYLSADVAEPLLRFHEWEPEQIADVIARLSQGRKAKAKDQCIALLRVLASRAGVLTWTL